MRLLPNIDSDRFYDSGKTARLQRAARLMNSLALPNRLQMWLVPLLIAIASTTSAADDRIDYVAEVKPILESRCFACHGALKQESGLRLDTGESIRTGGDSGPAVIAANAQESYLIERISANDESHRMPPEGEPLTAEEIALITAWIEQGAESPANERPQADPRDHWAFQELERPEIPAVKNALWVRNPVDAFIAARHETHGLRPVPPARKEVLLRRVYLDLTGLPPTREELDAFLADDSPAAYEHVVDRLLNSPHYGERWGRHWMDVWRYSDWYGRRAANDVRNSSSQIWRWRDWIIESLNDDKGYDRMILEMLAGDEIAPEDPQVVVATGFIVRNCYRLNFHSWKQDMVEHTAKAFLGLTFNCAHCHDHKYDPITQENYFQLRAYFEPLMMRHDRLPGLPDPGRFTIADFHSNGDKPVAAGLARVYDGFPDAPTFMYHRGDPRNIMDDEAPVQPAVPAFLGGSATEIQTVKLPPVAYYPGAKNFVREGELQKRQTARSAAEAALNRILADFSKNEAALEAAINNAEAKRHAAADALSSMLQGSAPDEQQNPAGAEAPQFLAEWRFEGDEEEGVLTDSGSDGLTLLRSTGNDERVGLYPLPLNGKGRGFFRPLPHSGASNRQAITFDQDGGSSFLYCVAGEKFHAAELTLELCVQIDGTSAPSRGTLVDYEGVWGLDAQGLNSSVSELQLRLRGGDGNTQTVYSNQGDAPLTLVKGHDYYLAVVITPAQVTFYAKNLTVAGDLQSVQVARDANAGRLAEPGPRAKFSIGSSASGRHNGLLDEVRLADAALSQTDVETRSTISDSQTRLAEAEQSLEKARGELELLHRNHTALRADFEDAQAQLNLLEARIAADTAKHIDQSPDAEDKARIANQAQREAALSSSKRDLARAMQALAQAHQMLWSDPARGPAITEAEQKLEQAREQVAQAMQKSLEPPTTEYESLTEVFPNRSTGRRTALAKWLVDRRNPLTARVAVNHIWMRHFGRPLVESVYDFGLNGEQPNNPELLDWLAVELMESGWRMKSLHRLIVTSNTYQMQSKFSEADAATNAADPENRNLWRFHERRMEAEVVRDSILAAAGQLDRQLGGPDLGLESGDTILRRSLYFTVHPEGGRLEFMSVFDPPDPLECYRREESVVPQQALAMTNSRIMLSQSRLLARELWSELEPKWPDETARESAFISAAFARILARYPTDAERTVCMEFLEEQVRLFQEAGPDQLSGDAAAISVSASTDPHMRARESLIGAVFSHNDFVTIR